MSKQSIRQSDKFILAIHVFKYHLKVVRSKKNDNEYVKNIITKIKPLIDLIWPDIIRKYKNDKSNHLKQHFYFEEKLFVELKEVFDILKQRLFDEDYLNNKVIRRCICILESMFDFREENEKAIEMTVSDDGITEWLCTDCGDDKVSHRVYVMPSYNKGIFDNICYLCEEIFQLNRKDLIKKLVEIITYKEYKYDPLSKQYLSGTSEAIGRYIFAPSLFEIIKLNDIVYLENKQYDTPAWVAYDVLYSIEWASKEQAWDFLRKKKKLHYNSFGLCIKNAHRLQLHALRFERKNFSKFMKNVPSNYNVLNAPKLERQLSVMLYDRKYIDNAVELVVSDILKNDNMRLECIIWPKSIKLFFDDEIKLCLKVEWSSDIIEVLLLHKFRDMMDHESESDISNKGYIFIKKLMDAPKRFFTIDYSLGGKVNVKKYLKKIGISGVLYDLFMHNETGSSVAIRSTYVDFTKRSKTKLKRLEKYFKKLEHVRWELSSFSN